LCGEEDVELEFLPLLSLLLLSGLSFSILTFVLLPSSAGHLDLKSDAYCCCCRFLYLSIDASTGKSSNKGWGCNGKSSNQG
jgi:hypothetical protein